MLAALTAVFVVAAACVVWFAVQADGLRAGASAANLAVADAAATDAVVEEVGAGLKAVFSYDYANIERTRQAADVALTGQAEREYRAEFAATAKRVARDRLIRASTVRSVGVRTFSDSRATLLVFLDQQTLPAKGATKSTTATLDVTAVKVDGAWRIRHHVAVSTDACRANGVAASTTKRARTGR